MSLAERVKEFNKDREPERLAIKYHTMSLDPFSFLRGTCHLFHEDLPQDGLPKSPLAWLCGDLHFQNYGTYKGDNRLVYFDMNDFDEACLGPGLWDVVRLLTSLYVGAHVLGIRKAQAHTLVGKFLEGYGSALSHGKPRWIERATAEGMVRDALMELKKRTYKAFIASRTKLEGGKRKILLDGKKALPLLPGQMAMLKEFAATSKHIEGSKLVDAARRIAGTGSLGIERYALLVEGDRFPHTPFLLDLKFEPGSCLAPYNSTPQPKWENQAECVVFAQHAAQAVSMAFLTGVKIKGRGFVLRELSPLQDRVALSDWKGKFEWLEGCIFEMGQIAGWGNLRSSGKKGSAIADEWIAFGGDRSWRRQTAAYAEHYAENVKKDHAEFKKAYDEGFFGPPPPTAPVKKKAKKKSPAK